MPGRASTHSSALSEKTWDGGASSRSVTGSTPPVRIAIAVAPVLARHAVDAAVGSIAHIARGYRAKLVRQSSFDDIDQFITHMLVGGHLQAGW